MDLRRINGDGWTRHRLRSPTGLLVNRMEGQVEIAVLLNGLGNGWMYLVQIHASTYAKARTVSKTYRQMINQ